MRLIVRVHVYVRVGVCERAASKHEALTLYCTGNIPKTLQFTHSDMLSSSMWKGFPKRAAGCCGNVIYIRLKVDCVLL